MGREPPSEPGTKRLIYTTSVLKFFDPLLSAPRKTISPSSGSPHHNRLNGSSPVEHLNGPLAKPTLAIGSIEAKRRKLQHPNLRTIYH